MPIPRASDPIAGQWPVSVSWRAYLEALDKRLTTLANTTAPEVSIPDAGRLIAGDGVTLFGSIDYGQVATVSLRVLPDSGVGAGLVKITRDAYGRVEGTEAATTTDLPEGANLYYTDERVRDAVGATLVAGANITITPNDGADTITIAATGGGAVQSVVAGAGVTVDATDPQNPIVSAAAGILPMVNGDVPPVLMYQEDGSLIYFEV